MPLRSLRSKILLVLIGAALIAAASGAVLTMGIRRADQFIDRAHLSQNQLELLLLLAGRVSDYGLIAAEAARAPQSPSAMVSSAATEVSAVLDLIEASIEKQMAAIGNGPERDAEAAEGLGVARMRAMFQTLDRQIAASMAGTGDAEERVARIRGYLDVFGISFSPVLARAVENERRETQTAWGAMTALKQNLLTVSILLAGGAVLLGLLLYFGPLRSVLRRLGQTVEGAEAIASGRLDTRLEASGRDELGALMSSFNRMAVSLGDREEKLLAAQQDLQRAIDERTADLRAANGRLEEIDAHRRRFFQDVSHELRTPLTVILGETELMLRQGAALPDAVRASLTTIQNRARRLNRRVDDMLRVARSESGRLELHLGQAEAGEIVADAVEDTLALAKRSGIELRLERGPGNLYVHGDRDWLRQVFSGLIVNAIKFTKAPGVIEVKAEGQDGAAVVEISDEGSGVPGEDLHRVFDRFYRGGDGWRAEGGHGVGLALAKWIIDEHRGRIELQSPGRLANGNGRPGTTVMLRLDLARDDEAAPERTDALAAGPG